MLERPSTWRSSAVVPAKAAYNASDEVESSTPSFPTSAVKGTPALLYAPQLADIVPFVPVAFGPTTVSVAQLTPPALLLLLFVWVGGPAVALIVHEELMVLGGLVHSSKNPSGGAANLGTG
jgi:hypothetical protein